MKQLALVRSNVRNEKPRPIGSPDSLGYTLVELLVVLIIAATMTAVALPVLQGLAQ